LPGWLLKQAGTGYVSNSVIAFFEITGMMGWKLTSDFQSIEIQGLDESHYIFKLRYTRNYYSGRYFLRYDPTDLKMFSANSMLQNFPAVSNSGFIDSGCLT
jgi:hypothetical protein